MTITKRVENILEASHNARNSDIELQIIYMQKAGMHLSSSQIAVLKEMPSFETLRRIRQKLQEHGKYPADPEVNERRYRRFKKVRENISTVGPEELLI